MRPSRALPTGTSERSSVAGAPGAATVNGVVCFAGGAPVWRHDGYARPDPSEVLK
jgi:hypothetical protein